MMNYREIEKSIEKIKSVMDMINVLHTQGTITQDTDILINDELEAVLGLLLKAQNDDGANEIEAAPFEDQGLKNHITFRISRAHLPALGGFIELSGEKWQVTRWKLIELSTAPDQNIYEVTAVRQWQWAR